MKRIAVSIAALAVFVASCSGGGAVVATVDGAEISLKSVEALFPAEGAVPREQFATDLRNAIVETAIVQAGADEFEVSFTDEEIQARYDELVQQVEGSGVTYDEFLQQQQFTDERVRRIAHQLLLQDAIIQRLVEADGPISEQDIASAFEQQLTTRTEACVKHILLETEEDALAARDRLVAGEDFETVAKEVSTDPSAADNGGDLGCSELSRYVPEFAVGAFEAEIGTVTLPVRSQFGYHLILVESRTEPALDDVRSEIATQLDDQREITLFNDWLLALLADKNIEVDPAYGTWVTDPAPQVLPPE